MKWTVGPSVVAEAGRCLHAHSCLERGACGDKPLCDVLYADGENILFLCTEENRSCPYRLFYAGHEVCTCPVRFAIFRLYGR